MWQHMLHNDATVITTCSVKTVRLKKAMSKQTNFFFSKQHEAFYMKPASFYCCRRHKFSIEALLCNSQHFYIVDSDI